MAGEIPRIGRDDYLEVRPIVNHTLSELRNTHPAFVDPETRVQAMRAARISAAAAAIAMKRRERAALMREKAAYDKGRIDPMTGIESRRGYANTVRDGIWKAKRIDTPATLVLLDLNGIHEVNRQRGRQEGDRQIITMARILSECSNDLHPPARWGGDEFSVLHVGVNGADAANWWHVMMQPRLAAEGIHVGAGAATYEPQKDEPLDVEFVLSELTRRADQSMYLAKAASKTQGSSLLFVNDDEVYESPRPDLGFL